MIPGRPDFDPSGALRQQLNFRNRSADTRKRFMTDHFYACTAEVLKKWGQTIHALRSTWTGSAMKVRRDLSERPLQFIVQIRDWQADRQRHILRKRLIAVPACRKEHRKERKKAAGPFPFFFLLVFRLSRIPPGPLPHPRPGRSFRRRPQTP